MVQERRNYNFSDANLWAATNTVLIGANRDVAELTPYGIDQAALDALEAQNDAFANLPTDVELSQEMAAATEAKDLKRAAVINYLMVEIMARVELAYGGDSKIYKQFGAGVIHNCSDPEFYFAALRIRRKGASYMSSLPGLNTAILTTVDTMVEDFKDLVQAQGQSVDNRDVAVRARVLAGNTQYQTLVKIANLGKRLWLNVDESRYNDYVLYPNQNTPANAQVVESPVNPGTVVNLSVTDLDATSEITGDNPSTQDLFLYFTEHPTDFPNPLPSPTSNGWLRAGQSGSGTAAEAGFVPGEKEYLNVYNPGPGVGNIRVTVVG